MRIRRVFTTVLAFAILQTSSADEPKTAEDFAKRGKSLYDKGEVDAALAAYPEALRLNPNYGGVLYARGRIWYDRAEWDKALKDFDLLLRIAPHLFGRLFFTWRCLVSEAGMG